MREGTTPLYEKTAPEHRTPLGNDVDPDGMDSDSEGDELEAGPRSNDNTDAADGPDGALERRSAGQHRTSGTHGAAPADTQVHRSPRK